MMKNENLMDYSINSIFCPGSSSDEFGCHEDYETYCKIRDEINKFLLSLNQSKLCRSIRDQVHALYLALSYLENAEKELMTSNLTEEVLYQEKIIEDIHSLKMMVLNYIRDLSEEMNN